MGETDLFVFSQRHIEFLAVWSGTRTTLLRTVSCHTPKPLCWQPY